MTLFLPVLASSDILSPRYRWRLVDGLFARMRPAIEGSLAVAAVAVAGWERSGSRFFLATIGLSLAVIGVRIAHNLHYHRRARAGRRSGETPERWARQFMALSLLVGMLWGLLNVGAFLTGDVLLQMFVMTVQSGWLGAFCTRNAASPATAVAQAALVLVPCIVCGTLSANHFLQLILPLGLLQFSATLGVARALGTQIVTTLLSQQELEVVNSRLTELSATDGLTGIANRRAFDAALAAEWGRAARDGTDLGLLLIDVDQFKAFNDSYGHPAGDDCLRLIADVTANTLRRPPDIAARFGGEEFVAILPGTSQAGAMEVGERVRMAIFDANLAHLLSAFERVTVSVGAVSLAPHPGTDPQVLIDLADRALYEAKDAGRNQVIGSGAAILGPWMQDGDFVPKGALTGG